MPHFTVEYSANLGTRHDMAAVARLIAERAGETGVFPLGGIRVRLYPSHQYVVADDHPDNGFLAVLARIGAGRDEDTRKRAAGHVFEALRAHFAAELETGHFMLSLDVLENDPATSFKQNSVHARLEKEKGDG